MGIFQNSHLPSLAKRLQVWSPMPSVDPVTRWVRFLMFLAIPVAAILQGAFERTQGTW